MNGDDPDAIDETTTTPIRKFPELTVIASEEIDEEFEDDEFDDARRSVLITGACGDIGRKLRVAWADLYDLVLIDRNDDDTGEIYVADLSIYDEEWASYFEEVDTVVHLAADSNESAPWHELEGPNLDAMANVLNAAALAGVERFVFASSNHVMGGYREYDDMPITVDLPPRPDNAYGASKWMGERLGKSFARAFDMTFVSLRLGWVQIGRNAPASLPDPWARSLWLSNKDLVRLFGRAVEADFDDLSFVVVNGLSNNRGSRWDLTVAEELLGFIPEDDSSIED